jgi:formylglycine-generating enzyme required for sulfatase activity
MHGNVWEWCQDTWHESYEGSPKDGSAWVDNDNRYHLLRGGSWNDFPHYCRSASRDFNPFGYVGIGFRVACGGSARIL